jgi:hypothetical protein
MTMLKKLSLAGAAFALGATALIPAAPAAAQYHRDYRDGGYYQHYDRDGYGRDYDRRSGYYGNRGYDRGYYDQRDYRRCRDDGTGGTIIGAIAGGLLGNAVSGYGDHTLGTVLGAGAGALAGRAIDRSDRPGYCR